ncbi:hypothetical protein A4H97_10230 [Niastella yeongjuensis]|uniref:Uncharacterized protein n=1 Tax=Niastella yeongjuensis TaxID=354355 RepID=A0A1V9EFA1_9BACT|nr:hypothetical protein [Niastella yeongjuensis]OQP44731.1 hypothetical protein A4H97_10230 [Niastella yeongjuensis]SEO77372.1 hypothetical protein SAMN05660816_03492 [Niastella yeongjuensis]
MSRTRTLTPQQKDELRQSFTQGGFSAEAAILKLVAEGYEPEEAKALIVAEFKEYKTEVFNRVVNRNNSEEARKGLTILIMMISVIGPLFDITSPLWYIVAIAASGITGYFAFKTKPIAGVLGSIIMPIVFPFAYNFYFSGRTSFIRIEMLIPIFIAAVPAFIIYYIISKTVYAKVED